VVATIEVPSMGDYSKALKSSQDEAQKARAVAAAAKANGDQLSAVYKGAKQSQDMANNSRRADLLKLLKATSPKGA
jgi:hypothetical protein